MKADERSVTPNVSPIGLPQVPPPAEPTPSVADGISELWGRARQTLAVNPRAVGVGLAVALVAGAWWFWARESRLADSHRWAALEQLEGAGITDLADFATQNKGTTPGRVARLDEARRQFGPNGIAKLTNRDARAAGLASVASARDEFARLADEFSRDETLRAECLRSAAEAELALVGVPADGGGSRGSVEAAVKYLRAVAATVGPATAAGERATKRADDLEKNAAEVTRVGQLLNSQMTPLPVPEVGGPKPPTGVAPTPPAGTPDAPKPPTGPVTVPTPPAPPTGTPIPPPATKPESPKSPPPAPVTPSATKPATPPAPAPTVPPTVTPPPAPPAPVSPGTKK